MSLQRTSSRARQRGLSFIGLIFIGVLAVAAFAIGGQSVPIMLESLAVKKAAAKAASSGTTVAEIKAAFDRAATIDQITSIKGDDLQVSKRNDKIVVSYNYSREIALFGPAYLVYRFSETINQ